AIISVQVVMEIDLALILVAFETPNTTIHQVTSESKRRIQQPTLGLVHQARANAFIRRNPATTINSTTRVGLLFRTGRFFFFFCLILATDSPMGVVVVKSTVRIITLNQAARRSVVLG